MSNRDNIEITLITENDRERMEQVAQMETDVFPDPWSYHEVRSTVRQKHTFCAAAMEGDTLLGYFLCYYVLDECEIARIAVAESERRRGIGQMLFGFMDQICHEKQLKRMLLDVRKSNQTAIAFYEKNKFGIDGERKLYYGGKNPEDAILMSGMVQKMEEIARISLDNPENAVPYIVREVFSSLIDITKKDTANLAAPTDEQVQARKKLISNFIVMENAKQGQGQVKLPYQLTEKDFALANELSPMEQAERNKEYALYTISILAKIYTDEVEKQTGNIVPLTDLPGSAAIVDALRFNPNSGVKIAAIDALRHIQRPEYKEELTTLYTLAQADSNPQVSMAAERALNRSNV